jgi:hypothetical protein
MGDEPQEPQLKGQSFIEETDNSRFIAQGQPQGRKMNKEMAKAEHITSDPEPQAEQ